MNKESIYLLKVLTAFIEKKDPGDFQGDWGKLIELAGIHSVTGILGYMIMKYPSDVNMPVSGFMREQCLKTLAIQSQRSEQMKRLIQKMNQQQIDHLLFKGYIVKDYYPEPELRTYGDIDFLIRLEDRKISDQLMIDLGFERKTDWEPVFSYFRQMEYYEIHTDVMEVDVSDKADYKGYFQHIWEHAKLVEGHTYELEPEFHFLYLLTHIAKHISSSGAGIRMYIDIAVFIEHFGENLDWDYIQKELKTLCFEDFANMVLTVVWKYFHVESPINLRPIEDQILEDFMEFTFAGGVFGHVGRDSGLIYLKNQDRNEENVSRVRTFLRRLFAPANELEKRYTYLKGHHWLLPIAWVHRLFKTKDKWNYHAQEAKSIMNTDTEEVLKLRRIYKEIGL